MNSALILLAKAPSPGFGKSRLIHSHGWTPADVCQLADAFVRDTLTLCANLPNLDLHISFAPADAAPYFRALAPTAHLSPQADGDLGARIHSAFETAFAREAPRAVVIGSDTPHLAPRTIERALLALQQADCVFGPSEDGGYYLIALNEPHAELFRDIEWSTERVLAQSLSRARELGLRVETLEPLFDLDSAEDIARLELSLATHASSCPETRRVLAHLRSSRDGSSTTDRSVAP